MMWIKKNWTYGLLALAFVLGILGVATSNFIFKSGTAAIGIIIILILNFRAKEIAKDSFMILGAFLFSIIGDWFLSNMKGDNLMFVKGIALFFLAHVGYLAFALMNGRIKWRFTLLLLAAYLIFFFAVLYPTFTDMVLMTASLIYLLISCFSLGASMGMKGNLTVKWSYIFGIVLILFSDTIISLKEFLNYNTFDFLITPTYYLAHLSIIFALINKSEHSRNPKPKEV